MAFAATFIKGFLEAAGLMEWLLFWGFLLGTPIYWFGKAVDQFRKKGLGRKKAQELGRRYSMIGLAFFGGVVLLLVFFGRSLITMTIESAGSWIIGLLIAVVVCLLAFPICLAGAQLRQAYECQKGGYTASLRRRALIKAALGMMAVLGVALSLYFFEPRAVLAFSVVALLAIVVGWSGNLLVPGL